jgi:hypothetical protein
MPCEDQTEHLSLTLDAEDRIAFFSLQKVTCGRTVGEQVLAPYVQGLSANQYLSSSIDELVAELDGLSDIEAFLLFKQYVSLRAALLVWVGERSGEIHEPFVVEEMSFDADGARLTGMVAVELLSEEIESCGRCKGCGSQKKKKKQAKELTPFAV